MRAFRYALVLLVVACNGTSPATTPATPTAATELATKEVPGQSQPPATNRLKGAAQATLPWGKVELETAPRAAREVRVEVASTPRQRELGLMFREKMGEDEGMMFVFDTERRNSFWMRNTLLPLDMIFISSEFEVVGVVENAEPLTDDPRSVPGLSQYVLEVNAGYAKKHGVGPGTKVRFTPPEGT